MREVWFDLRVEEKETENRMLVNECYVKIISYNQFITSIPLMGRLAIEVNSIEEMDSISDGNIAIIKNDNIALLDYARSIDQPTAQEYYVCDKETMILASESKSDYVIVRLKDITNIPLELILAASQAKKSKVLKYVSSYEEAEIAFGTMENGVNGVIISTDITDEIMELVKRLDHNDMVSVKKCKVNNITHLGLGTRMCIDTIDMLEKDEGCIVGSTIYGGILISSETHYLPYMNLRPFRVNAGGIHSYVVSGQDKTVYMSEIEGGSKVMIINTSGHARQVTVGRAKMEKRPMVKISANVEDIDINVIVQDDWHIRVFDGNGKAVSIMDLKIGDEILGYCNIGARHVGMRIEEQILER